MKLILLRHEKRGISPGFFTSLTDEGLSNSELLVNKLNKYKINKIYCSPLLRTLQTIYPYYIKNKKKINVEYALYEYRHNPHFSSEPSIYDVKDLNSKKLINVISKKYKSKFKKEDFDNVLENEKQLGIRLLVFFNYLKKTQKNDQTILFVSHKGVINKIKKMFNNKTNLNNHFGTGNFEIINLDLSNVNF